MKNVSIADTARIMAVSSATIRNWAKAGHITPVSSRPLLFSEESVLHLRSKIGSASFEKLQTRANKARATSHFLPTEHSDNPDLLAHISNLVATIKNEQLTIEAVVFLAALRLLEISGEVKKQHNGDPFSLASYHSWVRQSAYTTIHTWHASLCPPIDTARYQHVYTLINPYNSDDFLGLLYQSALIGGNKSAQGSFYTPSQLVNDALSQLDNKINTFLDPCCGSGKYLIMAAKKFNLAPENLYGFDCDKIATHIASINLLLTYKNIDFSPNIICLDSLAELATGEMFCATNKLIGKIDAIATNPPWGAYKNATSKLAYVGKVKSGETFAMFLEKAIQLLRDGGQLSFILPESILKIKIHADIRGVILNNTQITKIAMLGRQFTGVFTPVIQLNLSKTPATKDTCISIVRNGEPDSIMQSRFSKNTDYIFDIATESNDEALLQKCYAIPHLTLANNAEWALGIVTGDNKKFILNANEQDAEAIYRGSDVHPYYLGEPKSFIHFVPNAFQQVAPARFFRATEKLVYKFISKQLSFAYDDKQCLTLNSANILIPALPSMSIKVTLAFLNSAVFQYIFSKKFATHKVLRGNLERLPFPLIDITMQNKIEQQVNAVLCNPNTTNTIDMLIFAAFDLNKTEIAHIKASLKR